MSTITTRQELGQRAHDAVTLQFQMDRRGHCLIADRNLIVPADSPALEISRSIGRTPEVDPERGMLGNRFHNGPDGVDPYLEVLCWILQARKQGSWLLEPAQPGIARRPDLCDVNRHEAYEIKPDNAEGFRAGRKALDDFLALLRQADLEYLALRRHSERYRGPLYERLERRHWQPGAWVPQPAQVHGETFVYRMHESAPGVILWRLT